MKVCLQRLLREPLLHRETLWGKFSQPALGRLSADHSGPRTLLDAGPFEGGSFNSLQSVLDPFLGRASFVTHRWQFGQNLVGGVKGWGVRPWRPPPLSFGEKPATPGFLRLEIKARGVGILMLRL